MKTIKSGRKLYDIHVNDYILDNGACYQFITGDGRSLKFVGWHSYTNVIISKAVFKKLPFSTMIKKEKNNMTYYIFTKKSILGVENEND
jgi:hypothetical protein